MHTLIISRDMPYDADRVFSLLDDFSNTWVYHPIVRSSDSVNGIERGLGAARRCELYDGQSVQERVTEHDPGARRYVVEVFDHGPFPTRHMVVTIEVEPTGAEACRVSYTQEFQVKYGPMGWLMGELAMKRAMGKMLGSLLEGVERHLETGRIIEEGGALGAPMEQAMAG